VGTPGVSAARRERGNAFCDGAPPNDGGCAARQNRRPCPGAPTVRWAVKLRWTLKPMST